MNLINSISKLHHQLIDFIVPKQASEYYRERIGFTLIIFYMWFFQGWYCFSLSLPLTAGNIMICSLIQILLFSLLKFHLITLNSFSYLFATIVTIFLSIVYFHGGASYTPAYIWTVFPPMVFLILFDAKHSILLSTISISIFLFINYLSAHYNLGNNEWSNEIKEVIARHNLISAPILLYITFNFYITARNKLLKKVSSLAETNRLLFTILMHDLKNPVLALEGAIDKKDHELAKFQIDYLKTILHGARDFAFVDKLDLKPEISSKKDLSQVQIKKYIHQIFHEQLNKKGISYEIKGDESIVLNHEPQVFLNHIFGNFFSNAIKFSPQKGHITLEMKQGNVESRFSILDQGKGLNEYQLEQISNESKLRSARGTMDERGSGFGLQIALETLKRLDCNVEFQNRNGLNVVITSPIPL